MELLEILKEILVSIQRPQTVLNCHQEYSIIFSYNSLLGVSNRVII
jgi:hypothetical protein